MTREAVKLIDREGDLLSRGIHEKNLEGLRKRIANLFLVFLKTPEFNPEAEKYQKVTLDEDPDLDHSYTYSTHLLVPRCWKILAKRKVRVLLSRLYEIPTFDELFPFHYDETFGTVQDMQAG